MKTKVILFFTLIFTIPLFAQLNKAVVEANFPLLTLPFELSTKDVPTMSAQHKGWIDYDKYKYIKGDVTAIIKNALSDATTKQMSADYRKKMIDHSESKIHAIGRVETPTQNFILYNLNLYLTKSGAYDIIYVASLDKDYKIIDIANSLQYLVKSVIGKDGNVSSTLQTVIIKDVFLNSKSQLTIKEYFHFKESLGADGVKTNSKEVSQYGTIFLEDGKAMDAIVF